MLSRAVCIFWNIVYLGFVINKLSKTMTTMTNYRTLEVEELEIVLGGTVTELDELITTMEGNGIIGDVCGALGGHVPSANNAVAAFVKEILDNLFGIRADISLGWAGTGIGSDPNTYIDKATGRKLTHAEAITKIRRCVK